MKACRASAQSSGLKAGRSQSRELVQYGADWRGPGMEMLMLSGVLDAGVGERRSATNVDKIALGHNTKWAGRLFILECVATRKKILKCRIWKLSSLVRLQLPSQPHSSSSHQRLDTLNPTPTLCAYCLVAARAWVERRILRLEKYNG